MILQNPVRADFQPLIADTPNYPLFWEKEYTGWEKHAAGLYKDDHQMKFEHIVRNHGKGSGKN